MYTYIHIHTYIYKHTLVVFFFCFGLVSLFNGMSTFVGNIMPKYPCRRTALILFNP